MTIPFFNGIDYPIPSTIWSRVKFLNAREIISTIYLFRKETVSFINFINDPRAKVLEKNSVRRWITTGLESRRTFKICSARRRETAGKSAETLRENINSRRMAKGEGERREEREREREKSDYFRKFMKVRLHNSFPYCDALCSRDGLTWNLRPLLLFTKEQHHGLVIPVRFLRICLIYYVSRKYKIDDEWIKFYIYIFHFQYPLFHYPPSHCT